MKCNCLIDNKMKLLERFLRYVSIDTQSCPHTHITPSSSKQMSFARSLAKELRQIGLKDVTISNFGYVTATLPSNINRHVPTVGFIAHMDTSPDFSGKGVRPQIIQCYDGTDVKLSEHITMTTAQFPELLNYVGQSIITTDGSTLLGADDKAGIAEIVTAMEHLIEHPDIQHGTIRIAFTPDEEIGEGADHFDVQAFGADFAYTIDGGEIGELEYENFNAAAACVSFTGVNVHPGYAAGKMRNSMLAAQQYIAMLPNETPANSSGREGFFHLTDINGDVELTVLNYIIRDFEQENFQRRKMQMIECVDKINALCGSRVASIEITDQYANMRQMIEPKMHIVDIARRAMQDCKIEPKISPVRGGTDGARLSFLGLPTPNIFAGGHNFHGKYEFVPVESMQAATAVVVRIAQLTAQQDFSL